MMHTNDMLKGLSTGSIFVAVIAVLSIAALFLA